MPSAYSRTSRSFSENSVLVRCLGNASIFSDEMPLVLLTAEPMSIQKGHPTSVATLSCARFFKASSTSRLERRDCSIWP